ncbi:MAG: hypothetical protein PHH98_03490 [Candidatus Gracilibacteria bacterium]|nr:hypothetical protein [Candidatus Gracilibacteria bacterium]
MGNQVIDNKVAGIESVRKDIKRLKLDENAFIVGLNSVIGENYTNLDEIPSDLIPDLVEVTKSMIFHIIGLNTIIKKIGVENIGVDFDFTTKNTSDFVRRLASDCEITSEKLKKYISDERAYIDSLLIHDIEMVEEN